MNNNLGKYKFLKNELINVKENCPLVRRNSNINLLILILVL